MSSRAKPRIRVGILLTGALLTGCAYRSPVLMTTRQSTQNPKQLPLRVGVVCEAGPQQDPTSILTVYFVYTIPTHWLYGQYPKPIEMEYFADCVVDYLRDYNVFQYTYPYPYDPRDVDFELVVRPTTLQCSNSTVYSTTLAGVSQFPYLGLAVFFLPLERFESRLGVEMVLKKPNGPEVATYHFAQAGSQWVWIYQQPFGEYLWYNSIFRSHFMAMMDSLRQKIEQDSRKIMAAVGRGRAAP